MQGENHVISIIAWSCTHHIDLKSPLVKKHDLSSVVAIMSGAAPLSAELTKQLIEVLPNAHIGQGYGKQTHLVSTMTTKAHEIHIQV